MAKIPPGTRRPGVAKGIHRGGKSGREGGRIGPKSLLSPLAAGASGRRADNQPGVILASFSRRAGAAGACHRVLARAPGPGRQGLGDGVVRDRAEKWILQDRARRRHNAMQHARRDPDPRKTVGMQKTRLDPMSACGGGAALRSRSAAPGPPAGTGVVGRAPRALARARRVDGPRLPRARLHAKRHRRDGGPALLVGLQNRQGVGSGTEFKIQDLTTNF